MTKEMIRFCEKNFSSIVYNSIVSTNTEAISLRKPMNKHLELLKDIKEGFPTSFLVFKYFNQDMWFEEDLLDTGEYKNLQVYIFNKFQINLLDGGMILIKKHLNKNQTEVWTKQSDLLTKMNEVFILEIDDIQEVFDYFIKNYGADFKKKKNELIKDFTI
jgi:hypothetical protein